MKINTKLIVSLAIPQLAGLVGSVFTASALKSWYVELAKPALNPPSWIFGPVWTTLFVLMGIALYLVWKKLPTNKHAKTGLVLFGVQLGLNVLWSVLFFGLRSPGIAFIEIVFLWLAILATIVSFAKVSKKAAWMLVPYILWVSFASYLNYSIFILS
jgi:tryptophan-rich sensory protein